MRKRLCCCDNSTRELLWHSEHKERGESRDSELPLHTSLISSGNSMPPARPPNPPGKERPLHRHSKPDFLGSHTFTFLSGQERNPCPTEGQFPQIPCADQSRRMLSLFRLKKQGPNSITMRPILPWNVPMRGCCAQTHTVPRIQQRPNSFPQKLVPHLRYHASALPISVYQGPSPPVLRNVVDIDTRFLGANFCSFPDWFLGSTPSNINLRTSKRQCTFLQMVHFQSTVVINLNDVYHALHNSFVCFFHRSLQQYSGLGYHHLSAASPTA